MFITLPDGLETRVEGGSASADGTWSQAGVTYPHQVPGRYTFEPKCVRGATVIFAYQPVFFSMEASPTAPTGGGPPPTSYLPRIG